MWDTGNSLQKNRRKKKKKSLGGGWIPTQSHPTLIQTHQFTSLQTPTHSNNPPIHPPPIHTHTITPYTSIHPHTQPQDSIHMPMHRLLGIRHSGHQSNVFWVYVSRTFPSVFWFVVTGFWFSLLLCILDQPVCGHCHQNALPLKCFYWFRCPICGGKIGSAGNFQCPPHTVQTHSQ